MQVSKFKTNINCEGCIKSVTPHLNALDHVESWQVDIDDPDKVLRVELEEGDEQGVIDAVERAGFSIEKM